MALPYQSRSRSGRETSHSVGKRALRRFLRHRAAVGGALMFSAIVLAVLLGPLLLRSGPNQIHLLAINRPPSPLHWLGTDGVGRDILARLLAGGRVSLMVGAGATGIALLVGSCIGSLAGVLGGWVDAALMRLVDLAMTLPPIVLLLVVASITGPGILTTTLVIGLLSWPLLARLVRARFLEIREQDYVTAARGLGAGTTRIILRHGLPNLIDVLVVFASLQLANAILLEAGLSFIGLGIPLPTASWGNMINAARSVVVLQQYPWQWLPAGIALALTVLCVNFVGDGLRDALDPRSDL